MILKVKAIPPNISLRAGQSVIETDDVYVLRDGKRIPYKQASYGDRVILSTLKVINGTVTKRIQTDAILDMSAPLIKLRGGYGAEVEGKLSIVRKANIHDESLINPSFKRRVR
jgi:hypothetical protein